MFVLGVSAFAVASAGCGFSSSIRSLVVWRSVQGIAAAFLVPGSLDIISSPFDEESRGRAIGTWAGFTTMTTALGPVLGGWLIEHASWHWIFFINVPLAALVLVISFWHVPESRSSGTRRLDWLGVRGRRVWISGIGNLWLDTSSRGGSLVFGLGP